MNIDQVGNRLAVVLSAILLFATTPTAIRCEGLIHRLPEDGSWVRFEMQGKGIEMGGATSVLSGSLTLKSVGQTVVNGEKCRWIEIDSTATLNGMEFRTIDKLLIPEKYLKKGEEPLRHLVRAWMKHPMIGNGEPQELSSDQELDSVRDKLRGVLAGPTKESSALDRKIIDCKLGKLDCEGAANRYYFEQGAIETQVTIEVRIHDSAPFGVVTYEARAEVKQVGKLLGSMTQNLKLAEFGKHAKSALPENM